VPSAICVRPHPLPLPDVVIVGVQHHWQTQQKITARQPAGYGRVSTQYMHVRLASTFYSLAASVLLMSVMGGRCKLHPCCWPQHS
jgi:hypothetical protein